MCKAIKTSQGKQRWSLSDGFTLVEMSIVLVIIGMVVAASAQLMQQRQEWLQKENTKQAIVDANDAITAFRNTYGRYPCPASLTATAAGVNAALYGIESNSTTGAGTKCADMASVAIGAGIDATDGYAVVAGPGVGAPRIRVGALPFKNLNIEEREAYDGYGNRIIYAVTESLAVADTFNPQAGGIRILNDQNASIIQPADSAHFIILTSGENGAGGFTRGGFRLPCAAQGTNDESENCNFDVDATFQLAQTSNTANTSASAFDDIISYATHEDVPLWEKNPLDKDPGDDGHNDVAMKNTGSFGIGTNASKHPSEDLQVEGIIIARDDPYTTDHEEGNIQSENICDYASDTTTCFPSSLIAGEIALGGGMKCPTGQFMTGIKNGAPICETEIKVECAGGAIAIGVKADGTLKCGAPPPSGCVNATVNLCTESKTLFAAKHGTRQKISASTAPGNPGGTRYARYRCDNGSWKQETTWGSHCDCTPKTGTPKTKSCKSWSYCGYRFTGNKTVQTNFICPSASNEKVTDDSGCVCDSSFTTRKVSCPKGFSKGKVEQKNTHNCGTTPPSCTGWQEIGRTCECVPKNQTRERNCTGGLKGKIYEERDFTCTGGPTNPGTQGGWKEVSRTCECVPKTETRKKNCTGGLKGKIDQERKFTCPSGPTGPGTQEGWKNVDGKPDSSFCTCTPSSKVVDRNCPIAGQLGEYRIKEEFQCPSGTTVKTVVKNTCAPPPCVPSSKIVDQDCPITGQLGEYQIKEEFQCPSEKTVKTVVKNTCKPPPPVYCIWNMVGTGGANGDNPLSRKDGGSCPCGSTNNTCSKPSGGKYKYGSCECK